ncbi:putative glyoxalase superfamily protein PhnB [Mesorhizobium sp. J18]|uniref:VOC family protein n=1 Tax=Mesorhizobium sp. J18 TaxID=935263 RepID=UPI00119A9D2B|nr:VOC family protein [Mesorhizobium sp. J18]TWH01151.1 putative glyoxalase superfamily protein PhnB [Mesorhizobium sp. J18]
MAEAPRIYPTFRYRDPARMIDWLSKAFGFKLRVKYGEDDRIDHAELALGSSMIMLGQVRDDGYGAIVGGPGENGGKSVYLAVEDIDAVYASAKAAGAEILTEPYDTDYGSRDFMCRDPEGNIWSFGTYWPKAGEKPM